MWNAAMLDYGLIFLSRTNSHFLDVSLVFIFLFFLSWLLFLPWWNNSCETLCLED